MGIRDGVRVICSLCGLPPAVSDFKDTPSIPNLVVEIEGVHSLIQGMSVDEILDELPRLTHAERRLLCRRALAIDEAEAAALEVTELSAADGFVLLDRMETDEESHGRSR